MGEVELSCSVSNPKEVTAGCKCLYNAERRQGEAGDTVRRQPREQPQQQKHQKAVAAAAAKTVAAAAARNVPAAAAAEATETIEKAAALEAGRRQKGCESSNSRDSSSLLLPLREARPYRG